MKILHIVEPFSSGIITFIINLTKSLPEHEHIVLHGNRTTEDQIVSVRNRFPKDVNFLIWEYADRTLHLINDLRAFINLFNHIRKIDYDVIHLHSAKAGFLGRLVCFILRKKNVVYTPNGAPFIRSDIGSFSKLVYIVLEKLGARLAGKVICCGRSESMVYLNKKIENIYINNGVEISEGQTPEKKLPITLGIMSIITFQKNPSMFNTIANHFKNDKRIKFIWVGNGELRHLLDEETIEVTGWVDSLEARKQLNKIDVYFSTSLWEGQPFAALEAMNHSKSLLLHKCIGNIDLIDEGVNGYLFSDTKEAVEKIKILLNNINVLPTMGQASKLKCIKSHDLIDMGHQYLVEYEKLVKINR